MNLFSLALVIITLVCLCLPCPPVRDWLDGMDKEPGDDC
jgi:hypothetical protein